MYRSRKLRSLISKKKRTNRRKSGARRTRRNKKVGGGFSRAALAALMLAYNIEQSEANLSVFLQGKLFGELTGIGHNFNAHQIKYIEQTNRAPPTIVNDKLIISRDEFKKTYGPDNYNLATGKKDGYMLAPEYIEIDVGTLKEKLQDKKFTPTGFSSLIFPNKEANIQQLLDNLENKEIDESKIENVKSKIEDAESKFAIKTRYDDIFTPFWKGPTKK